MELYYYKDFFPQYDDDFGYCQQWNREINKWLETLYNLNKKHYTKKKKDLSSPKKRHETLGEIEAIFYCKNFLGATDIKLEPPGKGSSLLDFIYSKQGIKFHVEVKSPSWRGEILGGHNYKDSKQICPSLLDKQGGSFGVEYINHAVKHSIANALNKFNPGEKNILIIIPDMSHKIQIMPRWILKQELKNELEKLDKQKLISSIIILEAEYLSGDKNICYNASHYFPFSNRIYFKKF